MTSAVAAEDPGCFPVFADLRETGLAEKIARALSDPCALGVIERNVELKIVAPLLELLGWDSVLEVLWGFQIPIRLQIE